MKRIILITCLACISSFFSSKASANLPASLIDLRGPMQNPSGTVRTQTSLVEAYLNANSVDVVFNFDLGSLTVDVINQSGDTVFHTTVDAVAGGGEAVK